MSRWITNISDHGTFVSLPADLKISNAKRLNEVFNEVLKSGAGDIFIDAKGVYNISPFTACWFAALKDQLVELGRSIRIIPPEKEYALHQYSNLGIETYLKPEIPQTIPKKYSTFPVTKLTEPSYPLAGTVSKLLTERLRKVENFHKALHFAIREVVENSFEHGKTNQCYMCAYSVPSKQMVRLCILDTGIGIPASMRANPKYTNLDDLEAVERASQYGVSSKAEERGIGLYLLRDVAEKNEAELTILSGHAKIDISKSIRRTYIESPFSGTAVKLTLRTRKDFYYISVADWEAL
ncbi:MAG: ATP-binding protein [bacterium]|nr:ATP-binding protein [bacterium]